MYDQDTNLIFTKKKKKNTIGRFTGGGNRERKCNLLREQARERERAIKGKRGKINERE